MAEFTKKYNPNRNVDWNYGGKNWKLSRSKIELFLECPRCFYLDNKLGTARPRGPAFTLNVAVDELFKKEFDEYRQLKKPHPIMKEYDVDAVPFSHKELNQWRDNFSGITHKDKSTEFIISGAIDDIWEKSDGSLIVVDYKATAKEGRILNLSDSSWEASYRRQIGVYQWLLRKNGFAVDNTGFFVYTNARVTDQSGFHDKLSFDTTLVPCIGDITWIDETLPKIKICLTENKLPEIGKTCEYCLYREASGKKLQAIYHANKIK